MRKQGKKWAAFLLCCLLLPVTPVKAETTVIEIVDYRDGQETVLQTFGTVKSAADYYAKHRDDASVANLGVRQDGKLIAVDLSRRVSGGFWLYFAESNFYWNIL